MNLTEVINIAARLEVVTLKQINKEAAKEAAKLEAEAVSVGRETEFNLEEYVKAKQSLGGEFDIHAYVNKKQLLALEKE